MVNISSCQWFQRVREYLTQAKEKTRIEKIDGQTAANLIVNGTQAPLDASSETELASFGLHIGDDVICRPTDTGKL